MFCADTASCFDLARREMQEESLTDMNKTLPRRLSHPREVHLLPLLAASGARGDAAATKLWRFSVELTAVSARAFD